MSGFLNKEEMFTLVVEMAIPKSQVYVEKGTLFLFSPLEESNLFYDALNSQEKGKLQ